MLLLSSYAQTAASASLLKDLLVAVAEGRLHEVQSLLDEGRCEANDEDEVCTSRGRELVYENIVLCVVCACISMCTKYGCA